MGTESVNPDNFYMCLNIIGEKMEKFLKCISNIPGYSLATDKQNKLSIYDYWDYLYYYDLDFFSQLA